jgi:2',3'-cyclic-nucleotide 2'-phosphodiesterase (5'-nucleotidase family)
VAHLLKGMSMIGYDAINLGEKDLQYGAEFLNAMKKEHDLPLISANIYNKNTGKLFAEPFVIKKVNDLKVGIFGIETDAANPRIVHFGFEAKDPVATAKEIVEKLQKKCDVVIALSHIGLEQSKELAAQVEGIDFIVSGYRWDKTYSPVTVGETVIMQTGTQGKNMGHITFNVKDKKTNLVNGALVNLNEKIAEDEKLAGFVKAFDTPAEGKDSGTN